MTIPHVDVKAQYAPLLEELKDAPRGVLDSGRFILGPEVRAFEEEAAAYLGVADAVGVANGTDALVLVLDALGRRPRRRGHLPRVHVLRDRRGRFAASAARPSSATSTPATLNLDPADVAERVTPSARRRSSPCTSSAARQRSASSPRASRCRRRGAGFRRRARQRACRGGRRRRHVQLLPDQEPLRPRRRRARRHERRRACRPRPPPALPRLARTRSVRGVGLQLAPRRAPGRGAAPLPRPRRPLERRAPRGRRALRRARPRRARASCRRTSPATSTTCTSCARPSGIRIAAALRAADIGCATYYTTPLHLQPVYAASRLRGR